MKTISDYVSDRVFDGVRPLSKERAERLREIANKRLSDFTRVVEETGVLDQDKPAKD